jgi:hypothetical protein
MKEFSYQVDERLQYLADERLQVQSGLENTGKGVCEKPFIRVDERLRYHED